MADTSKLSMYERFGLPALPLDADDFSGTFAGLDPARDILLDFFAAVLNEELKPAAISTVTDTVWGKIVASTKFEGKSPVEFKLPHPPGRETLTQIRADFPMLAVYRDGTGEFDEYTIHQDRLSQPWRADYVLGTLDLAERRQVADVLPMVAKLITLAIRSGKHEAYNGGVGKLGQNGAGLHSIGGTRYTMGPAQFSSDDDAVYWGLSYEFRTIEVDGGGATFPVTPYEGASLKFGLGSSEGELPELIDAVANV